MSVALSFMAAQAGKEIGMAILKEVAMKMAIQQLNSCKQSVANRLRGVDTGPKLTLKQKGAKLATQALHETLNSQALNRGMQAVLGSFGATVATASFVQANQEDLFQKDKQKSDKEKAAQKAESAQQQAEASATRRTNKQEQAGRNGMRR